jgi:REP element-mobilizing transposase RayT
MQKVEKHMQRPPFDPDRATRYTRKSFRLKDHHYGWTASYFVTIRAARGEPLFEKEALHAILHQTWETLPERFPSLTLDACVIMPDHIHFIIHLEGNVEKPTTLGRVVGAYKSLTTVFWLRHLETRGLELPGHIWQRDYYEHIIRDGTELEQKRNYIRDNPRRWQQRHETTK